LNRGRISLGKMAQVMAENVARQYDMYPTKGVLQPGSDADIVVFDSKTRRATVASALPSASKYSIYEGEELAGWPTHVFIRGELVAREGRIVSQSPAGRYVPKIGS
jgi:dihydropyrimidinase